MAKAVSNTEKELAEHFFRNEYGKMVAVVAKYLGTAPIETAEDLVQDTLLAAVEHWQRHGIPDNPAGWLYTTVKNKTFNILKHEKYKHLLNEMMDSDESESVGFSDEEIADDQLRMMYACCHPGIGEEVQLTLILKILCGFSAAEIAAAFFTNTETINKRLVRGRKKLKIAELSLDSIKLTASTDVVLKSIYLLFNEGYSPSKKSRLVRTELSLEAIRLAKLVVFHPMMTHLADGHALLSLMYLNASRFEARINEENLVLEMEKVDRSKWNKDLIDLGLAHLENAQKGDKISGYLIMAGISAHHCIAPSLAETDWHEILKLYDAWLKLEDQPVIRLNRAVVLSKVFGTEPALVELLALKSQGKLKKNHLLYLTIGELYLHSGELDKAIVHYKTALEVCQNERDLTFLNKKLETAVLISKTQL
ncbi:MAG: sigma-70 family RNA polymerase sigma factor [Reichenbachiella sp.]|uniref:RNA polymerase sigma factor n=1 Tax=Reichenbachiella sp. TaxID=2184521 RepID=UPI00326452C2